MSRARQRRFFALPVKHGSCCVPATRQVWSRPAVQAFTLIELLVVVPIISLLAALLMPGLKNAREQARSIKCLANLKQMGTAALMYADDNNGKTLANGGYWGWTTAQDGVIVMPGSRPGVWLDLLFPYVQNKIEVLECPSSKVLRSNQMPGYPPRKYAVGYLMNLQAAGYPGGNGYPLSLIKRPEEKVWFADGSYDPIWKVESWAAVSCFLEGNAGSVLPISKRHRGGSNLVFFDGHAQWKLYKDIMPISYLWEPQFYNNWDPDEDQDTSPPSGY